MPAKVIVMVSVLCLLAAGHAPRMRELRNPDAEGGARIVHAVKRTGDL